MFGCAGVATASIAAGRLSKWSRQVQLHGFERAFDTPLWEYRTSDAVADVIIGLAFFKVLFE